MRKRQEKQFWDLFAISKKGSGAHGGPPRVERGRGASLVRPFKWDPTSGNGTRSLAVGPYVGKGTHILQMGPVVYVVQRARRRALSLRGYPVTRVCWSYEL
jgi:hypothetical protein